MKQKYKLVSKSPFGRRTAVGIMSTLMMMIVFIVTAYAGNVLDFGQLNGLPTTANYMAWVDTNVPPSQVLTEDSYNSGLGSNLGYENQFFLLNAGNFDNPAAAGGDGLNMLFGNDGAGTIWQHSATYDLGAATTDHGTVPTSNTLAGSCPVMTGGSQTASVKVINWTDNGAAGVTQYHIYRSQNASGAGNDASNGRYDFVATVPANTETFSDTACGTAGTDCWHIVVPADANGNFAGCHSTETDPVAIDFYSISANNSSGSNGLTLVGILLVALAASGVVLHRRRQTMSN